MKAIHISTLRKMFASGEILSLRVLTSKGEIRDYPRCQSLRSDKRTGCRNIKLLDTPTPQFRKIKDILIIQANDLEVYI